MTTLVPERLRGTEESTLSVFVHFARLLRDDLQRMVEMSQARSRTDIDDRFLRRSSSIDTSRKYSIVSTSRSTTHQTISAPTCNWCSSALCNIQVNYAGTLSLSLFHSQAQLASLR